MGRALRDRSADDLWKKSAASSIAYLEIGCRKLPCASVVPEAPQVSAPTCPRCDLLMVIRRLPDRAALVEGHLLRQQVPSPRDLAWVCVDYSRCLGTRSLPNALVDYVIYLPIGGPKR